MDSKMKTIFWSLLFAGVISAFGATFKDKAALGLSGTGHRIVPGSIPLPNKNQGNRPTNQKDQGQAQNQDQNQKGQAQSQRFEGQEFEGDDLDRQDFNEQGKPQMKELRRTSSGSKFFHSAPISNKNFDRMKPVIKHTREQDCALSIRHFESVGNAIVRAPGKCRQYLKCENNILFTFTCPAGFRLHPFLKVCETPEDPDCQGKDVEDDFLEDGAEV